MPKLFEYLGVLSPDERNECPAWVLSLEQRLAERLPPHEQRKLIRGEMSAQ